jgi:hypothetical protein
MNFREVFEIEDPSLKRSANRSFKGDYAGRCWRNGAPPALFIEAGRGATVVRPVKGKLNSPVMV